MSAPERTTSAKERDPQPGSGMLEALYYLDLVFGVMLPGLAGVGFLLSGIFTLNVEHIVFGGIGALCAGFCWLIAKGLKDAIAK